MKPPAGDILASYTILGLVAKAFPTAPFPQLPQSLLLRVTMAQNLETCTGKN